MIELLPLPITRAVVYLILAAAPLSLLQGHDPERRAAWRGLLRGAIVPAALCGLLVGLAGRSLAVSATVVGICAAYLAAWVGLHAALGRGRLAAAVVALTCWLPIAATFAPNSCVESPPGRLVHPAAAQILVHVDPVFTLGHQLLDHPVMVSHYFYHQGDAPPPPAGRLALLHVTLALGGLGLGAAWPARTARA